MLDLQRNSDFRRRAERRRCKREDLYTALIVASGVPCVSVPIAVNRLAKIATTVGAPSTFVASLSPR